ncbi:MAG: hydantoinase B/oxoprolinase family protein [Alphaproteobacteria bacterium]|nr:hydantoinase B/oxoprolinase family protein [Alphaproteobacteria bacterium]
MDAADDVTTGQTAVDPITLEVIRHGVVSITDQIDANITRTAFSPYIYEYRDFAVGLVGPEGESIAQCRGGMPIFVADSVGMAVRDGIATYGLDNLHPGDVILCNHAAIQGQHLNNTVMYTPVFAGPEEDRLVGFFAINVHWIDVGGSVPRSRDIFEEGLQLRSIKLWSKGAPIEEVYRIIGDNTRTPEALMGDIEAQLAGCLLGRDLTRELAERYGPDTYLAGLAAILDQSESATRARIRDMPDGTYESEAFLDNDGEGNTPVPIRIRVIVDGDELTVDYSDMAEAVPGCINSGYYGGGRTTARVAFKYLLGAQEAANEGTFRPLKLILPEGKLLSAPPTAPMGNYGHPFPTIIDAVIRAFEQVAPDRVTGGHYGTFAGFRFLGTDATGAPFDCHVCGYGGWGASARGDGGGPFRTMAHGDTKLIPMELQEALYPVLIEELALRPDSGGAGRMRGGLGMINTYLVGAPCRLVVKFDRVDCPPWGVAGGKDAKAGWVTVEKAATGERVTLRKDKGYPLEIGDRVIVTVGGGGGWGAPGERDAGAIARDIRLGYVTPEAARTDYGRTG